MKKLGLFVLLACFAAALFAQTDATTRRRYALVIGNQNYKYATLSSNVADAQKISNALAEKEFDVTFKKNLDSSELKTAVNAFVAKVNADARSVALIYLSGHAFTYNDKNYFLPVDNDKFHTSEDAASYGLDIESELAQKIKTAGQIYIIDGAYDAPFEAKGSRAIGVKGGLAAAKSARESTVGFLFSAHPDTVIPQKFNSVFADAFVSEIATSEENLSSVFEAVKARVSSKTGGEQSPYSSATNLDFAFNGNELIALKKAAAIAAADKASIDSLEMSRKFKAEQELRNEQLAAATETAIAATENVSAEIAEKRRLQQEEDARRREEEERRALERSAAATSQILALREEFAASEALLRDSMKKNASAEERVDYIESMKANLYDIRKTAAAQIADFNAETDALTAQKVTEIDQKPLKKVETREDGTITLEAQKRRENDKQKERTAGEEKKLAYKLAKDKEVSEDDKKWLPKISAAYAKLEGDTYIATSFDEALTVRVADYDGSIAKWRLHVSADLFGHADVFEDDIYLSYSDVTNKKTPDVSKLSEAQLDQYNEDVEVYDSLFRSGTPVFYVKLYYKIMRWDSPSEYHFIPKKCEIIRLGKKNKVITTITESYLNAIEFTQSPAVEIRSGKEIAADAKRASATHDAEMKKNVAYQEELAAQKQIEAEERARRAAEYKEARAERKSENSFSRKGRNTLYVSCDFGQSDIFENSYFTEQYSPFAAYEKPIASDVQVHLTFNLAPFYYWGLSGGRQRWNYKDLYDDADKLGDSEFCDDLDAPVYFGKYVNGITIPIGRHFRLFGEGGICFYAGVYNFIDYNAINENPLLASTNLDDNLAPGPDNVLGFTAGGGFDIIFTRHLMMSFGANYNWMHYLRSFQNGVLLMDSDGKLESKTGVVDALRHPDFHYVEFNLGLGFTW